MGGEKLSFEGQTVVVTGAGGGLGKAYAVFFGSRGANVVVNDLGGSAKGEGKGNNMADEVVKEIKQAGGKAVANYDDVLNGEAIIKTAIDNFGRIDVLISNAGILRDISFKNMKDQDWDLIMKVHVIGAYKCARAAWPYWRKQKYGRLISTASAAGLFGSFGQTNYSAAKLALVGFTEALAKEGAKYNILCNVIAPIAGSRLTATVMPPEVLEIIKPEYVVPLVAVLVHPSNKDESGSIWEVGGGHIAKMRWQRSKGALLRANESFTPGSLLKKWDQVCDFSEVTYPDGPADFAGLLEDAGKLPDNPPEAPIDFKGKVALITGGGAGLGRIYCLQFAKYGAKIVVNDLGDPEKVVKEIKDMGGEAVGVKASAEEGDQVVKAAIDAFGRVDIIVNNAGILRDKSFANMTDEQFTQVLAVHLRGTYKICKAAWPYMVKQKYGRIVNTTSTSGIYGNFGQVNYSTAKAGILGFGRALAREGAKYNIYVNTIAPNAGTAMTQTVLPEELVKAFKPDYVAPIVLLLCSDKMPEPATGRLFESGSGWAAETRWQRSGGWAFPVDQPFAPEDVLSKWDVIRDFDDGRADNPSTAQESTDKIVQNAGNKSGGKKESSSGPKDNKEVLANIEKALKAKGEETPFSYTARDIILYNLGIGAKRTDLPLVFESDNNFHVVPTFGVIPQFSAAKPYDFNEIVPNYSFMQLLHGEQYLEIRSFPIPTEAETVSVAKLEEVVDKGNAAVVVGSSITKDKKTGKEIFYNSSTIFIRKSGGFGGNKKGKDFGMASKVHKPPQRKPDTVIEEKTTEELACLYRLSGDYNPLHVDPEFSKVGGFKIPILHGLCSFGIAGKHILNTYGMFKNIKVRFAGVVIPGETLVTEMWKEGNLVVFQQKVKETGKLSISGAGAELLDGGKSKL